MRNDEDPLAPARGVIYGTAIGAIVWAVIIALGIFIYKVVFKQ